MRPDDLLPYPLAGADTRQVEHGAGQPDRAKRSQAPYIVAIVCLIAALLWTTGQWQRERAAADALRRQADSGDQPAVDEPVTVAKALSPEMVVASAAVERYLQAAAADPAAADAQTLSTAFFGVQMRTTAWTPLPGSAASALARLDDPQRPSTIWVSRRSAQTIDPSWPSKRNCLQLDVAGIVAAAAADRPWGGDGAPLRRWSEVYRFVPPEQCGP